MTTSRVPLLLCTGLYLQLSGSEYTAASPSRPGLPATDQRDCYVKGGTVASGRVPDIGKLKTLNVWAVRAGFVSPARTVPFYTLGPSGSL